MLNYVNSYSLSTPADQSKVILNLMQNYPAPSPEEEDAIQHELISSILLDADTALSLASDIMDSLDPELNLVDESDDSSET